MLVAVADPLGLGEVDFYATCPARGLVEHCAARFAYVQYPWIGAL
jgi:hypothetical protein